MQGGSFRSKVWPCGGLGVWPLLPFLPAAAEFSGARLRKEEDSGAAWLCLLRWQCLELPGTPESRPGKGVGSTVSWVVTTQLWGMGGSILRALVVLMFIPRGVW